ncbi:MAG TPA: hypothetical protein VGI40_28065 [Pirellulaceae bacterium]|jgi:hypothetical protein
MPLEYVKHEPISLRKHPDFSEVWLHEQICKDTSILGLGELTVIDRERIQFAGGRLDVLLADVENEIRYEVEIMLGATDPSHIIRTIEYWDLERRRYPAYDHVAVLIAEEVTSRFLNVIALFAGSIPIIAIQLSALQVGPHVILNFVKVLDQRQLRLEDPPGSGSDEDVDRSSWEARVGASRLNVCDRVAQIANEVANPKLQLKYLKNYVALSAPGSHFNVVPFWPKKNIVPARFVVSEAEQWVQRLTDAGIEAQLKKGRVSIRLQNGEVERHEELLRDLIHTAVKESQQ